MNIKINSPGPDYPLRESAVWPDDQQAELLSEQPTVISTQFDDYENYHDVLLEFVLKNEHDPDISYNMRTGGGKVTGLHTWDLPEAAFISERARQFYIQTSGKKDAKIEVSWASIYHEGSYLSPHGHPGVSGTVTYCLDPGNADYEKNLFSGKLMFADPRLAYCCTLEENCVTRSLSPIFQAGTMVLFPGTLVHYVHPYNGTRPRISLTWNIN